MNLSEIRNLLREEDIMLTKSLGQTFMHDQINSAKSSAWPSSPPPTT